MFLNLFQSSNQFSTVDLLDLAIFGSACDSENLTDQIELSVLPFGVVMTKNGVLTYIPAPNSIVGAQVRTGVAMVSHIIGSTPVFCPNWLTDQKKPTCLVCLECEHQLYRSFEPKTLGLAMRAIQAGFRASRVFAPSIVEVEKKVFVKKEVVKERVVFQPQPTFVDRVEYRDRVVERVVERAADVVASEGERELISRGYTILPPAVTLLLKDRKPTVAVGTRVKRIAATATIDLAIRHQDAMISLLSSGSIPHRRRTFTVSNQVLTYEEEFEIIELWRDGTSLGDIEDAYGVVAEEVLALVHRREQQFSRFAAVVRQQSSDFEVTDGN